MERRPLIRTRTINQGVHREVNGEVGDHADDGSRDAGERGAEAAVVTQSLDMRCAEEDKEEARYLGRSPCRRVLCEVTIAPRATGCW